jgi:hypothetical protein
MTNYLAKEPILLNGQLNQNIKSEISLLLAGLVLVNVLLAIWSHYDCALPVYDMACHLLSGAACADLLAHAHPTHRYWWNSLFAVNPLYPPFVYIIYGIFKLAFGQARWVELVVQHFFSSILFISLYGLGRTIFKSTVIAIISSLIIFAFPIVFLLTHYDMLDIPGLSMVALSLLAFIYWQKSSTPLSSILLGTACALTALTKNNSIAFLIAPFAVLILESIQKKDSTKIKYFLMVGAASILVILPWVICACRTMLKTVSMYQNIDYHVGFIHHISYYLGNLPILTSYFLFLVFVAALCSANKSTHKNMRYLSAAGFGGIFILSLFHWTEQIRYALPATIPIALYCGWALHHYWLKPKTKFISIIILALTAFAFIENSYTPYPLPRLSLPQTLASFFGIEAARAETHHAPGGTSSYPTPPHDWGHDWVFNQIQAELVKYPLQANSPIQQFAIMPDSEEVSATSYAYLVRRNNLPLHAFTPRNYTLLGDEFTFVPKIAKLIDWYLLKTGSVISPASHFCNKKSETAYIQWCEYVRNSNLFQLVGRKKLPNNEELELYKKKAL